MNMSTDLIPTPAQRLNQACFCRTLNQNRLLELIEAEPDLRGLMQEIARTRPHLFSSSVVFISSEVEQQIVATVAALERVSNLAPYQAQALARAPAIARADFGPLGACMGIDFHLGRAGPQLIEINTNAGGALLNAALARAQEACCRETNWSIPPNARRDTLEADLFAMFLEEWRRQRGSTGPTLALIVDDDPATQYLAPEFDLFRQLFQRHGLVARVADPAALEWRAGQLWHQGEKVDLVYNRLTDFYLSATTHQALRSAYEAGAVVLTPHPRAHALHADKRNLVALSDDSTLAQWRVAAADRTLLARAVPKTVLVDPAAADQLWARRRQLFFKPVAGFGARAAYRGDKLTRRVWNEILAGDFVAQALVPPAERLIELDGVASELKFDIRAYTYAGQVQLLAARMYSGQTTNFRTPGGGFAPVMVLPAPAEGESTSHRQ